MEPPRHNTITIKETHMGTCTCIISASILKPIKMSTIAMPCCRKSNLLTAPLNKKNSDRNPSTANMLDE
jgi:hypothetical protein